ncbi:MAG: hypothetical protein AMXMBFR58_21990 [Phycisphaerae bacterium]
MEMRRAFILVCAVLAACLCMKARAQDLITPYLDEYNEPLTALDVLYLTRRAGLSDDQREMALMVLEDCRANVVAAQRRLSRAQGLAELEAWEIEDAKRPAWQQKTHRRLRREYFDRVAAIEKDALESLRVIVGRADVWPGFLRQRRIYAYLSVGSYSGIPPIERIIDGLHLATGQKQAVAVAVDEYLERLDGVVRELLAHHAEYMRAYESEGGVSDDQERAFESRRVALLGRLVDVVDRGQKQIASLLPDDRVGEFLSRVEVAKAQRLLGAASFHQDEVVRDLLRISTLTPDQRAQMRRIIRQAEEEAARHFRPLIPIYEAAYAGRSSNQESRQDELYEAANKAAAPITAKLRQELLGALNSDQRRAFEEGIEPPLMAGDEHWGEDMDRQR